MSMHVVQDGRTKHSRVAVVVSKKIHKSAVKRNRIRRRIYENIRPRLDAWKSPSEVVITVYQADLADMPQNELAQAIDDLLRRGKLL